MEELQVTDFSDDSVSVLDESTDESINVRYSISSYGADYPVDGLVQRLNSGSIYIPHFQREYVWSIKQASRFIESLLLGLPVPGVFLSKDPETEKLVVIDGQQRLKSLQYFYNGVFVNDKAFKLQGVQDQFEGSTYADLSPEDKLRMSDSIIHATIVRQEIPSDDQSSIYHVFERLNSGGTPLQPQEIRACIFFGEFNELLKELSETKSFLKIYGKPSPRLKHQELILRFFALYFESQHYEKPLKGFLNEFMGSNRHLQKYDRTVLTGIFEPTVNLLAQTLGKKAFRSGRQLNAAIYDSVMIGLARRLQKGPIKNEDQFTKTYLELITNDEFEALVKGGTSDETNVRKRLEMATEYFSEVN